MNRRTALGLALALSAALHAVLIPMLGSGGTRPGRMGAPTASRSVQVRALVAVPAAPARQRDAPIQGPGRSRTPERRAEQPTPAASEPGSGLVPPVPTIQASGEEGDEAYLPRSVLTVGPEPRTVVIIPYPRFEGDAGHYSTRLTLFIDEAGNVRRIEFDDPDLPLPLREAVRDAFMSIPFAPGQLSGRPVRSRMHIEVEFGAAAVRR